MNRSPWTPLTSWAWVRMCKATLAAAATSLLLSGSLVAEEVLSENGALSDTDERFEEGSYCDQYEVELEAGDTVQVDLRSEAFDTILTVIGPEESNTWVNDDFRGSTQRSHLSFFAPVSGTYRVVTRSYKNDAEGEYQLTMNRITGEFTQRAEERGELTSSDTSLPKGEYYDTYTLEVEAGTTLRGAIAGDGFTPYIVIQREGDSQLWEVSKNSQVTEFGFAFPITTSGEISIHVTSYSAASTGSYELTIDTGEFESGYSDLTVNARKSILPSSSDDDEGLFAEPVALTCEAGEVTVAGVIEGESGFGYCAPRMIDVDNDGQIDLVLGEVGGRLTYYRNTSSDPSAPELAAPALLRLGDGSSAALTNW